MAAERAAIACVSAATGADVADGKGISDKTEEIAWAAAMAERTRGVAMKIERTYSTILAARADSVVAIMASKDANEISTMFVTDNIQQPK